MNALNLFYEEPDGDRWLPFDRYPRGVVRRLLRGRAPLRGHRRVFTNLCRGLDRIGVPYRVNDYRYIRAHPEELACIVGKSCVLDRIEWKNPILFGASGYSHPIDDPQLFARRPIRKVLVPGPWMKRMCEPYWGNAVEAWPVGTDTEYWRPTPASAKDTDVLIYNKVLWDAPGREETLLKPIRAELTRRGHSFTELRYGSYVEEDYRAALSRCRSMIFLCEHETQGIAYQEALSSGIPIMAWDRNGPWLDPSYYPDKVVFSPVSAVPYWDDRCGERFAAVDEFIARWDAFWSGVADVRYRPRDYILANLTLERCARDYMRIASDLLPVKVPAMAEDRTP